jgi:hypothetical protein
LNGTYIAPANKDKVQNLIVWWTVKNILEEVPTSNFYPEDGSSWFP